MPGSITHKVILNYNNVSDSILHYDFRFLPIELESHNFLILPNVIKSVLNVLVASAEIIQIGKLFHNHVSKTILSYIISVTGFLKF